MWNFHFQFFEVHINFKTIVIQCVTIVSFSDFSSLSPKEHLANLQLVRQDILICNGTWYGKICFLLYCDKMVSNIVS